MTADQPETRPPRWLAVRLQRKFAVIAGILLVALSALFLVLVTQSYRARILSAHEQASLSVNLLLQSALENAMIKRDLDGLQDIVARLGAQDGVAGVMIANPEGEVRFSSYPDRLHKRIEDDAFDAALSTSARQTSFMAPDGEQEVMRSVNPVRNQARCQQCHGPVADNPINGLLIVDYESDIRQEALGSAILLGVLGVVVLLALEIGLWLALRQLVLGRLDRMEAVAGQVAQGALSERIDDPGQDEISRLGQAFDGMAGQLQSRLNELQASRGFLQSLIDAIPDGVRVIDADFNIVMANKAYCAQLGYEPGSVTGQLCHLSSHSREQPCISTLVRCPVAEILQGGSDSLKCNHTHVGADGADVSVEVSAVPATMIIDGIERPCIVESIRDLETGLAISQEQRLAEMGMLAAGVAHEVNNPLSSIALALRAIGAEPGQTDKAMKYVDIAEREITNCKNITESLLRLAAAPQSRPELVNMGEAVSDTMSLLKLQADQTEVILHKEVTGQPRVLASDSDMRILVFNLTLNAIHAMPQGGCVTVRCFRDGNMIRLEVEDQGIGIAARDRDKILLPFWTRRADGSRGRGLGLAISLSIVKSLGGTLDFESTLGEGTCFIVNLPSAEGTDE